MDGVKFKEIVDPRSEGGVDAKYPLGSNDGIRTA